MGVCIIISKNLYFWPFTDIYTENDVHSRKTFEMFSFQWPKACEPRPKQNINNKLHLVDTCVRVDKA